MALLRPCSTSAGFTATPEAKRRVRMGELRGALEQAGYAIVVDAGVVLIARFDGVESSIYAEGKVLLKTDEKDAAQQAYDHLRPHLEASWS